MQTTARPLAPGSAHALMHLTVFVWGFTAILGRLISLSALTLVWYRLLVVVLVMPIVIHGRRLSMSVSAAQLRTLAGIGALVALHWLLFYGCIKYAGVAVAVLCLSTVTFFTSLLEPIVFRRPRVPSEIAVGFGVMAGVSLLIKVETSTDLLGIALGIGSAFFSAAFGSLNGKAAREVPGEVLTFWELAAALLVTSCFFLFSPEQFVAPSTLALKDAALLAILAIGCTVLPWLWSLRVLQTLPPYTLALAVSFETVYAMGIAWFFFPDAEQLTPRFYVGSLFLLGLVVFGTWRKHQQAA